MNSKTLMETGFSDWLPLKTLALSNLPSDKAAVIVIVDKEPSGKEKSDILYIGRTKKTQQKNSRWVFRRIRRQKHQKDQRAAFQPRLHRKSHNRLDSNRQTKNHAGRIACKVQKLNMVSFQSGTLKRNSMSSIKKLL